MDQILDLQDILLVNREIPLFLILLFYINVEYYQLLVKFRFVILILRNYTILL